MEVNIENFLALFPGFANLSPTRIALFLSNAECVVSEKAFGDCYPQAIFFVTAHNLTMLDPTVANGGAIASEKVGDISLTYKNMGDPSAQDGYTQTQYGLQYLQLRDSRVIGALPLC
jgi:hypothetical protein